MKILKIKKEPIDRFFNLSPTIRWTLLVMVVIIFSISLYPGLVMKRTRYKIGDVARTDIKATEDFFIEDEAATEMHRSQAVNDVVTVYDLNPRVRRDSIKRLNDAYSHLKSVYEEEAAEPGVKRAYSSSTEFAPPSPSVAPNNIRASLENRMLTPISRFEKKTGIEIDQATFSPLIDEGFPDDIPRLVASIVSKILAVGVVANKDILLQEANKGIVLRNVENQTESKIDNLNHFYGPEEAKSMVLVTGEEKLGEVNEALRNIVVLFSQQLIRPNITLNSHETELRRQTATVEIKPVLYMIKKGEMLIREGERVTQLQLRKLTAMDEQSQTHRVPLAGAGTAVLLTIILVIQYQVRLKSRVTINQHENKDLLFLACVMSVFILLVKISTTLPESWFFGLPFARQTSSIGVGIPLTAGAMIVCLFMGREIALIFSLALSLCATMLLQAGLNTFIYFILGCTMASWWLSDCRERKIIIQTGAKVGVLNAVLTVVINIYTGSYSLSGLPFDITVAFLGGIGAGIITVGTAPVVEMLFGYTTDIKLLELANLDQPILRRLMLEAPGTYHHSVVVGSLVEAAAASIDANPILAKVCGYYHDIGKLKKPAYFIENQSNRKNRHDKLAPSMSALILIAHVKNGVEIARGYKLGQAIIDTIQQHHGSSLISYFYDKAKNAKTERKVNIDDFRYPGPRPQTREAALVMLADVVEAASRTLENPTPSRIQGLVQNLINKVFSDGQLDHCDITLKDLHQIAKSFNKILNGIHHHRIEYLDSASTLSGKGKNGNFDRKPTTSPSPVATEDSKERHAHIKRLGLS